MFAGIYYGAMYGGSTTSILMNTPGESSTMVTAMEGNLMAKNGRAGPALATAAIGSFVAGTIATVLLSMFAPVAADVALQFGPGEYFMIMLLAFTTVSAVLGSSLLRGMTSLFTGTGIGLIGMDSLSGQTRYSMGVQGCTTASTSWWWRWACSPWARHSSTPSSRSRPALSTRSAR